MISGPVYLHLDLLYVSRLLRLVKVALCPAHLITPFLFPATAVLSLFSFSECLVKLHNPDVKPLFSTSSPSLSLSVSQIPLPLFRPLFYIISAVSSSFYNPQLSVLFMFLLAETWVHERGHDVCVYKHVVCTHISDHDCRDTSFLQSLCSDGPREMIQNWAPVDQRRLM